jgi:hypothetical protein
MDVSLSCKVSWRENLILNGSFESWNESGNIPDYWQAVNTANGTLSSIQSPGGFGVKLINEDWTAGDSNIRIQQTFNINKAGIYKVNFTYKGKPLIQIYIGGNLYFSRFLPLKQSWTNDSFVFDMPEAYINQAITIKIIPIDDHAAYIDDVIINEPEYDSVILNTDYIYKIDNVVREIEDNIFAYRSANLDFSILDIEQGSGYFDIDTFFNVNTAIFRFDFKLVYLSSNLTRNITVFASNHDMKRVVDFNSNVPTRIDIKAYEILAFLKEKDMYLGELTQDMDDDNDPIGEPYYLYSSKEHDPNDIYEDTDTAINYLRNEFLQIITRRQLPITPEEVVFNNNIDISESDNISFNFDETIGDGENEYYILDAYLSQTNRVYLLLLDNDNIDEQSTPFINVYCHLFEIVNGSTLVDLSVGFYIYPFRSFFVHQINAQQWGYNDISGATIECAVANVSYPVGGGAENYFSYLYCFSNNSYNNNNNENNFVYLGRKEWAHLHYPTYEEQLAVIDRSWCAYINANGIISLRDYSASLDNRYYFANGLETPWGNYTPLNEINNRIYTKLTASISRFPIAFYYHIKNMTLGTMLKEITMLYDSYFYLDYDRTYADPAENPIKIKVYNRYGNIEGNEITLENEVYSDLTFSRLDFSGLKLKTYENDTQLLRIYIAYYDMKYGRGSKKYTKELFGIRNINLGDYARINSIKYLITYIEFKPDDHKTEIVLQEIK